MLTPTPDLFNPSLLTLTSSRLWLFENGIGDVCLSALLAEPMSGVLRSLEQLDLHNNRVRNAG